ncbi:MAG: polymer-forming cytoskeletal protein, partial [Verrucomicrobiota bacterium]
MKTTKPLQLLSLLAACALLLHGPAAFAQPLPPPADPNVQVEANDNGDETMMNAAPAIEEEDKTPGLRHEAIVEFGKDVVLKASDSAEVIVVIGGSAKILGKCDDVIVIGGELDVEGKVRRSAIVVLGTLRAFKNAVLNGDVVAVGGGLEIEEGATVSQRPVEIGFHGLKMEWLKKWLVHCVLKLRPLAPQVGWVWGFAGVFFLIYLLIAAAFPRPVQACVDELTRRPATTFLAGMLMILLFPILTIVLIMTVVGTLVVPFLVAAWIIGFIVGKVAILEFFGGKIGQSFGAGTKPIVAFIIGSILITLLYLVPFIGLITFAVISLWGLGASATALLSRFRRERPGKPAPALPGNGTNPPPSASIPSAASIENMAEESAPSAPPIASPGV